MARTRATSLLRSCSTQSLGKHKKSCRLDNIHPPNVARRSRRVRNAIDHEALACRVRASSARFDRRAAVFAMNAVLKPMILLT